MPRAKPPIDEEVTDLLDWSEEARCQEYDAAIFDTHKKNQNTEITFAVRRAVEVCLECPVMIRCLEHAVKHRKRGAIWGSMTDEERDEWAGQQVAV